MFQISVGNYHLSQNCAKSLTNAGSSRIDMKFSVFFKYKLHTSCIRNSNANTGIFHSTSDSDWFSSLKCGIVFLFYSFQSFYQTCGIIHNLSIRKCLARPDRIAVANLPWSNSHLIGHHVQQCFCRKTSLSHAKSTKCSCRRIVCIICCSFNLKILIMIRTCRMCARSLQHRTAKRSKRPCI